MENLLEQLCADENIFKFSGRTVNSEVQNTKVFMAELENRQDEFEICLVFLN